MYMHFNCLFLLAIYTVLCILQPHTGKPLDFRKELQDTPADVTECNMPVDIAKQVKPMLLLDQKFMEGREKAEIPIPKPHTKRRIKTVCCCCCCFCCSM